MSRALGAALAGVAWLAGAAACGDSKVTDPAVLDDAGTDGALAQQDAASTEGSTADAPGSDGASGPPRTFKVYVSGSSVEQRNRFVGAPFTATGARDDHGADPNRADEFGWMVPFADRLKLRDAGISLEWVGTNEWSGVDDAPYSGTYPTSTAPKTSALSGTDIPAWLSSPGADDLNNKRYCYDVALATRGGNDYPNADDANFKTQYKVLMRMLAQGSSCRAQPLIVVVARLPDDRNPGLSDSAYLATITQRYKTRVEEMVNELKVSDPLILVKYVDAFSKFQANAPTTAFPSPAWFDGAKFDFATMFRDGKHPYRLASIYYGEVVADGIDLAQLRALP